MNKRREKPNKQTNVNSGKVSESVAAFVFLLKTLRSFVCACCFFASSIRLFVRTLFFYYWCYPFVDHDSVVIFLHQIALFVRWTSVCWHFRWRHIKHTSKTRRDAKGMQSNWLIFSWDRQTNVFWKPRVLSRNYRDDMMRKYEYSPWTFPTSNKFAELPMSLPKLITCKRVDSNELFDAIIEEKMLLLTILQKCLELLWITNFIDAIYECESKNRSCQTKNESGSTTAKSNENNWTIKFWICNETEENANK